MFQRKTSRRTRQSRDRMLALKVSSPRIMFLDCLKVGSRFAKFGAVMLLVMVLAFSVRLGWQKMFVENVEDFQITKVDLTNFEGEETRFITPGRLESAGGLDTNNRTIFAIDMEALEESIKALPETIDARVTRRLPGLLKIEVHERTPVAWIACRALGITERDRASGLLVDGSGVPFTCASETLWKHAERLPVIMIPAVEDHVIQNGRVIEHEGLQAALELVQLSNEMLEGDERSSWVVIKDEIMMEMMTLGGIRATLSYYDLEPQLERLKKIISHDRDRNRRLTKVNLIPSRYVPVHYQN